MAFYIACGNCADRNPDRRNARFGPALEMSYFATWRMMGFAFHVRRCLIQGRAPAPSGLRAATSAVDASQMCAWHVVYVYACLVHAGRSDLDPVLREALRTVERVYAIEEPSSSLWQTCRLANLCDAQAMDGDAIAAMALEQAGAAGRLEAEGLARWYRETDWFAGYAAKLLRSMTPVRVT